MARKYTAKEMKQVRADFDEIREMLTGIQEALTFFDPEHAAHVYDGVQVAPSDIRFIRNELGSIDADVWGIVEEIDGPGARLGGGGAGRKTTPPPRVYKTVKQ